MTPATMQKDSFSTNLIVGGFICLFIGAFLDIIRGPLLPPIAKELGLNFKDSGWFLGLGSFSAGIATIFMIRLTNKFRLDQVIRILVVLGVMVCLLAPFVKNFALLVLLSVLAGSLISMLGSTSNILVVSSTPARHQSRMLAALHTVYGIGAAFASWLVGIAIGREYSWWLLFSGCLPLFLILLFLAKKDRKKVTDHDEVPTFQPAKLMPHQYLVVAVFCFYVGGEVTTSMWMTIWLMEVKKLSLSDATVILSLYFGVLLTVRMACAFFVTPEREKKVILVSLLVPPIVLYAILGNHVSEWMLLAIGLYGPFFPVFLARTSRQSPANWRSLTIWAIVAMNFLLAGCHLYLGNLADKIGIGHAFYLPVISLTIAFAGASAYFVLEKRLPALNVSPKV